MSTSKDIKKNDVQDLIASAKNKVTSIDKSIESVKSKKDFVIIPGFSAYEWNGVMLRNRKTLRILSAKQKTAKYQLIGDDKKNHDLSKEKIIELTASKMSAAPKASSAKVKTVKKSESTGPKEKSKKERVLEMHKAGLSVNEIVKKSGIGYTTVYGAVNDYTIKTLFNKAKTSAEIAEKVGRKEEFIINWLVRYKFIKG